MFFASITRLRLRSIRFLFPFIWYSIGSFYQAWRAQGNIEVKVRKTKGLTFWTLSLWKDRQTMEVFRGRYPHKEAMQQLANWCDEASFAHWEQESSVLSNWEIAAQQLRTLGRLSPLDHPSEHHKAGWIVTT